MEITETNEGRAEVAVASELRDLLGPEKNICPICYRPVAQKSDFEKFDEHEGGHLCWEEPYCKQSVNDVDHWMDIVKRNVDKIYA